VSGKVAQAEVTAEIHSVPFGEAMRVWARVALLSFGGPAGQIAVMHRIVVDEQKWIGEGRFLQALNFCTLLPGPEATQLAIYIGWLMHRVPGGLMAGTLFVLPGMLAIMALSWIYVLLGKVTAVQGLFFGLKAAVLVIVIEAVLRIGRRALRTNALRGLAVWAFVAIFFYRMPFPAIVLVAALVGWALRRVPATTAVAETPTVLGEETPEHARPDRRRVLGLGALFVLLWWGPVVALLLLLGPGSVFTDIGYFFSKMAVVTFGGAYAVLAYVAQEAVGHYHWLSGAEMVDGLGLAETTPGPLIMVTQFVGFLAAWRAPGSLPPLLAATLGGLLTTWVTFVPCFLWIFAGAPFVESLRANKALASALAGVTAAIVGVILNLAVWFGLRVLFADLHPVHFWGAEFDAPVLASANVTAIVLTAAAALAIFRLHLGMLPVLAGCSLIGLLYALVL